MPQYKTISFSLSGMFFEYDEEKNQHNIQKHGISFRTAARVFFDYDRIEFYDEAHSFDEDRYNVLGDTSAGMPLNPDSVTIGNLTADGKDVNDILFVVYTERSAVTSTGKTQSVTRIISARMATNFERGLYYGKQR